MTTIDLTNALEQTRSRLNHPHRYGEGVFTKVHRAADGLVHWQTTCSDDGVDLYGTRMTTDLHEDFIRNAPTRGLPLLTVSHFYRLAVVGKTTDLYREGRRLKAKGYFLTNSEDPFTAKLATAAANAALAEQDEMKPMRRIRTSIGFSPTAAEPEDLGIIGYIRGFLDEITMTTHPANSRVEFLAREDDDMPEQRALDPKFMEEDAKTIVGPELASELAERLKGITGRSGDAEDPVAMIYRAFLQEKHVTVPPLAKAGRAVAGPAWDGQAETRVRAWSGGEEKTDWAKFEMAHATVDPDVRETREAYGFIHHDADKDGLYLDLIGLLVAGTAASQGRSGHVIEEAQKHLEAHYAEFGRTAPWKRSAEKMADRIEDVNDLQRMKDAGVLKFDAALIDRATASLIADFDAGKITDLDAVEQIVDGTVTTFRAKHGEVVIDALAQRSGRKINAKKLGELETLLESARGQVKSLEEVIEWAKEEPAASDDDPAETRAFDDLHAAIGVAIRTAEESLPLSASASLIDVATIRNARYMEIEPDSSIYEVQDYQAMCSIVSNTLRTLGDIVMANLQPNSDDSENPLTLQDRQTNIQNAINEALSIINAVLMSGYGEGRSLAPADNSGEMSKGSNTTEVKPAAGGNDAVNRTGDSRVESGLKRYDEATAKVRQLMVGKNVTPEAIEAGLTEALNAAAELLPEAERAPVGDAIVERIAGIEVGMSNLQAAIEDLIEQRSAPSPEPEHQRNEYAPRRRSLRPAAFREDRVERSQDQPRDPSKGLSIREAARLSTHRQFGQGPFYDHLP